MRESRACIKYNNNSLYNSVKVVFDCGIHLSLNELTNSYPDVSVYPNPAQSRFTVIFPETSTELEILNSLGQIVESKKLFRQQKLELEIEKRGIYYIRIKNDYEVETRKLIVSRN